MEEEEAPPEPEPEAPEIIEPEVLDIRSPGLITVCDAVWGNVLVLLL